MKHSVAKALLLSQLFTQMSATMSLTQLVDQGFHTYLEQTILTDQVVASRKSIANVYGFHVLPALIKQKKYREHFTDFCS